MKNAITSLIYTAGVWGFFMALRQFLYPTARAKSSRNRATLLSRMRKRLGPPILCPMHAKDLGIGQMALLDSARCERCGPLGPQEKKNAA